MIQALNNGTNKTLSMSLLFNTMDSTLVVSYILYETIAQIWTAIKQTYSQSDNYAEVFDVHQKLFGLKQEELTVVEYINALMTELQKLDFYDPFTASCVADATLFKECTYMERLYKFLAGLNSE